MNGHNDLVKALIKKDVNILEEDKYGRTALYLALERVTPKGRYDDS